MPVKIYGSLTGSLLLKLRSIYNRGGYTFAVQFSFGPRVIDASHLTTFQVRLWFPMEDPYPIEWSMF